jgi:tetratricopeptide (TPR) repeat protein
LLYKNQGKYEQAEPLYQRALAICERSLGPDHPTTVTIRENYASLKEIMNEENT